MKPLRLAVDTNVLLDLAGKVDSVLDAFTVLDRRLPGCDVVVLPSVLDELAFLCDSAESQRVRSLALHAMTVVREEDQFRPLLELTCPPALIDELARALRARNLLPTEEVHDSLILAEAALSGCELLLTSDEHLRGVDHEHLTLALNRFDLIPPVIASPREIVKKFFH